MRGPAVLELVTHDAAETEAAGAALAACIAPGQVIALRGDLGAGKTTFVQGLGRGLHVTARVSSPTFVLVNEYPTAGRLRLVHVDTYRLGPAALDEAGAIGLEELLEDAELEDPEVIVAVEWAERVAGLLPPDHLLVELRYGAGDDDRLLRLTAYGPRSAAALAALRPLP